MDKRPRWKPIGCYRDTKTELLPIPEPYDWLPQAEREVKLKAMGYRVKGTNPTPGKDGGSISSSHQLRGDGAPRSGGEAPQAEEHTEECKS